MKLYHFHGSASSFRARIALNLKGVSYERASVDTAKEEQLSPEYLSINPIGLVPSLIHNGKIFTESLAIIEYLDEIHPQPALLPKSPEERARVRAIALALACGIQPLHPPRIQNYLAKEMGVAQDKVQLWCTHWINTGMAAIEKMLTVGGATGKFCHGDSVTLADIVLVPQVYVGANRFKIDFVTSCPTAWRIYQTCMAMPAFRDAAPDRVASAA